MKVGKTLLAGFLGLTIMLSMQGQASALTSMDYEPSGTYQTVAGLSGSETAIRLTADSDNTAGSNITFNDLVGTPLLELTELSAEYLVSEGNCNGGSPRFYTMLADPSDPDTSVGHIVYYISYNEDCRDGEQPSGNVAAPELTVETHGELSGSNGMTFEEVQRQYGDLLIAEIGFVVDNAASSENGQIITVDNVVTNAGDKQFTYTFEPAPTNPSSKDDCKNNGWKQFSANYKNQGECVSSVARTENSSANNKKNENSFVTSIRRFFGL